MCGMLGSCYEIHARNKTFRIRTHIVMTRLIISNKTVKDNREIINYRTKLYTFECNEKINREVKNIIDKSLRNS